jgi:S1-C subfamily serine protease
MNIARCRIVGVLIAWALAAHGEEEEAVRVYKDVSPTVVALSNVEGSGTGIVIGADGLILTNAHVITSPLPFTATIDVTA